MTEPVTHQCEQCGKNYGTKGGLEQHKNKSHSHGFINQQSRWLCRICGGAFETRATLRKHKKTHTATPDFPIAPPKPPAPRNRSRSNKQSKPSQSVPVSHNNPPAPPTTAFYRPPEPVQTGSKPPPNQSNNIYRPPTDVPSQQPLPSNYSNVSSYAPPPRGYTNGNYPLTQPQYFPPSNWNYSDGFLPEFFQQTTSFSVENGQERGDSPEPQLSDILSSVFAGHVPPPPKKAVRVEEKLICNNNVATVASQTDQIYVKSNICREMADDAVIESLRNAVIGSKYNGQSFLPFHDLGTQTPHWFVPVRMPVSSFISEPVFPKCFDFSPAAKEMILEVLDSFRSRRAPDPLAETCSALKLNSENLDKILGKNTGKECLKKNVKIEQKSTLTSQPRCENGRMENKNYNRKFIKGAGDFLCKHCNRVMHTNKAYTYHMVTHTGGMPFQCNLCVKKFNFSSILSIHMATHKGPKKPKCLLCAKLFANVSRLTVHKAQIHSAKLARFQCRFCHKIIVSKKQFKGHFNKCKSIKGIKV